MKELNMLNFLKRFKHDPKRTNHLEASTPLLSKLDNTPPLNDDKRGEQLTVETTLKKLKKSESYPKVSTRWRQAPSHSEEDLKRLEEGMLYSEAPIRLLNIPSAINSTVSQAIPSKLAEGDTFTSIPISLAASAKNLKKLGKSNQESKSEFKKTFNKFWCLPNGITVNCFSYLKTADCFHYIQTNKSYYSHYQLILKDRSCQVFKKRIVEEWKNSSERKNFVSLQNQVRGTHLEHAIYYLRTGIDFTLLAGSLWLLYAGYERAPSTAFQQNVLMYGVPFIGISAVIVAGYAIVDGVEDMRTCANFFGMKWKLMRAAQKGLDGMESLSKSLKPN